MDADLMINKVYADSAYVVNVNNVISNKIPKKLYVCQFKNDGTESYPLTPSGYIYEAFKYFDSNFNKQSINMTGDVLVKFMNDNFRNKLLSTPENGIVRQDSGWSKEGNWLYKPNGGLYNPKWEGEKLIFEVTYKNKVFNIIYNLKPQYPLKLFESQYNGLREYILYCGNKKYLKGRNGIYLDGVYIVE